MPKFDESNPKILTILPDEADEHNHAKEIKAWLAKWEARLATNDGRFGIMLVNEEHEHDENEPRNEEEENAVTAMITQFRRKYREITNVRTTGYASIFAGKNMTDEQFAKANERTAQFASYMFGARGGLFRNKTAAQIWLAEVADLAPLPINLPAHQATEQTPAAIFYGSTTGSTELIAERVQAAWEKAHGEALPIINVGNETELMKLFSYNKLLVGVPTWNIGKLQDDWEIVYPRLDQIDLTGKQIAIFGVGDQFGYPENFQDAIGILGHKFIERGGKLVGYTSTDGYEHSDSLAIADGRFMGLAVDDIGQPELTDGRIADWVTQVACEFTDGES